MKLRTDTYYGCWADYIACRMKEPANDEHQEPVMRQVYQYAVSLILGNTEILQQEAVDTFPLIEGEYSLPKAELWWVEFELWCMALTPRDRCTFALMRFCWR